MKPSNPFTLRGRLRPATFLLLLALESAAAALATFLLPADPKNAFLLGRSLSRWVLIGALALAALGGLAAGLRLRGMRACEARLNGWLTHPLAALLPAGLNGLLFAGLFILDPTPASLLRLAPLLVFVQAALLQFYWFFANAQPQTVPANQEATSWMAALTVLALLAAALLSGLSSQPVDGLPWDRPAEFLLIALVLPAALIIDWRVFARRWMCWPALAALLLQVGLFVFSPEAGFRVHVYSSPEKLQAGDWQPTYASILWPGQSAVITQPYERARQFPIEWLITDDYDFGARWFALDLSGTVTLEPGERLYFLVNGEEKAAVTLTLPDGSTQPGEIIRSGSEIPTPDSTLTYPGRTLGVTSRFIFSGEHDHQLVPLIARMDGSTFSPFMADRAWQIKAPAGSLWLRRGLGWLLNALLLLAAGLGLIASLWRRYRRGEIAPIDLFLATWALGGFWAASYLPPDRTAGLILPAVLILLVARLPGGFQDSQRVDRILLVSVGLLLLALFARLDLTDLREIELFPDGEDNFRYQVIARYIFDSGDILQLHRPPLIYKFLYPYLVGGLHVLFGQSPAAQFFLNAWCALLTALAGVNILGERGVTRLGQWIAAGVWLTLVTGPSFFLFYFRFGLIEPPAVLLYSLAILFALQRRRAAWLVTGATLTLLRLDYAFFVFSTLWLGMPGPQGLPAMLRQTLRRWRSLLLAGVSISLLPVALTLLHWLINGTLITSAADTRHQSLASVFEGWARIFNGGTPAQVSARFANAPLDMLLFWVVIYGGLAAALLAWVWKKSTLDRRWLFLFLALLLTYIIVRPTGYSPRFSTPVVVISLLALTDGVHSAVRAFRSYSIDS
ncbi:MAG TPA: hypothetical protein VIO36_12355 [Anaerolineaceae bacterium]